MRERARSVDVATPERPTTLARARGHTSARCVSRGGLIDEQREAHGRCKWQWIIIAWPMQVGYLLPLIILEKYPIIIIKSIIIILEKL